MARTSHRPGVTGYQLAPRWIAARWVGLAGRRSATSSRGGHRGGYNTIWMARALPADRRLITLELSEEHPRMARQNLDRAGVGDIVEVRQGPALQTLPTLSGPFDFVFIDADKASNTEYLQWALRQAPFELAVRRGRAVSGRAARRGA